MILHPIIDLLKRIVIALPDYAGGGEESILYPIQSGTRTSTNLTVKAEDGNKISGTFLTNTLNNNLLTISIWAGFESGIGQGTRTPNAQYKWFTIPEDADVSIEIENLETDGINGIAFGLAKPGQTTSFNGNAIGVNGGQILGAIASYVGTTTEETPIGGCYLVLTGGTAGSSFSFNIKLTVNGTRWI